MIQYDINEDTRPLIVLQTSYQVLPGHCSHCSHCSHCNASSCCKQGLLTQDLGRRDKAHCKSRELLHECTCEVTSEKYSEFNICWSRNGGAGQGPDALLGLGECAMSLWWDDNKFQIGQLMIQKSLLVLAEVSGLSLILVQTLDKGVCINSNRRTCRISNNWKLSAEAPRKLTRKDRMMFIKALLMSCSVIAFSTQATVPPLLVAGCLCLEVARQGFGSKSRQETLPLPELVAMVAEIQDQLDRHVSKPALQESPKSMRRISLVLDRFIESLCVSSIGRPGKCWLLQWCLCAWHYGAVPRRATFPESDFPKSEVVPLIHYCISLYK